MATTVQQASEPRGTYHVLGTRPPRHDALEKVTGAARYGADVHLPGMLHGKILRSPHAHARIHSIDTSKAAALPGVWAVATAQDFPIVEDRLIDFAELQGNSKLDEGAVSGGREIVMLSRYQNGARVNVCSGDSGGPILVLDPATSRLRQLAVTSAADEHCREGAIFAPIDSQRAVLRTMFDALMQGEAGAERNPF